MSQVVCFAVILLSLLYAPGVVGAAVAVALPRLGDARISSVEERQLAKDEAQEVEAALARGRLSANAVAGGGDSALHVASRHDAVRCIALLLAAGASPDACRSRDGGTPLMCASQSGHAASGQLLLQSRAARRCTTRRGTAMPRASRCYWDPRAATWTCLARTASRR